MCFKRKTITLAPITSKYVFVGFGINDYQSYGNDLRYCIKDIEDEIRKLKSEFPEFQCLKYFDKQVTTQFFVSEIQRIMSQIPEDGFLYIKYSGHGTQIPSTTELNGYNEALFLSNGPLIDDEIYKLQQQTPLTLKVLAKFDSCFSGDIGSRYSFGNPVYRKARFMPLQGVHLMHHPVNRLAITDQGQRWTIFSGCGEEQVSMETSFDGSGNGAFTYFDLLSYSRGKAYFDELASVRSMLRNNSFIQVPELSGPYIYETFLK